MTPAVQEFYQEGPRGKWDALMTAGVVALAFGLLSLWSVDLLHPAVWEDVSIAAGLRPPEQPFPGLYRALVGLLFAVLPPAQALAALPWLGRAGIALAAGGVYAVFRDVLPPALRLKAHMARLGVRIGRVVAALAALLFLCADPVWRAGQCLTPVTLFLCGALLATVLFFRFVRRGSLLSLYFCAAVLGLLSAETLLGFVLTVLAVAGVLYAVGRAMEPTVPLVNPLVDGLVREVTFKRLTYVWMICFVAGIAGNVEQFFLQGGFEATETTSVLNLLLAYFKSACHATAAASTGPGWLFGLLLGAVPCLLAVRLLPRAWDDDRFLPYVVAVLFVALGVVAYAQLAALPALWFWTWLPERTLMASDALLAFFLLFDVAAVAFALAVFGVDAFCRNYRRIAQQQYPESMQYALPAQIAERLGKARVTRKRLFVLALALVPLGVVPGRCQTLTRDMARVMDDFADETLREIGARGVVFTDGSFDRLVELRAKAAGRTVRALSLMAPLTTRERLLRTRVAANAEEKAILENDAASVLRTWVATASPRLADCAVQIGFEMWRRAKKPDPPYSGLMALPGGVDSSERARALGACKALGDAAYALADGGRSASCTDRLIKEKFPFVLWRLSRLAQMRARAADLAGDKAGAFREAATADELDSVNGGVQKMKYDMAWQKRQGSGVLTPREGLVIGLTRADFALAGRYAAPILRADPDDPRANFALGMMYYGEEKFSRAAEHLARCLVRRPDEPAVLNNLALVELRLGRLDAAEEHARRAFEKHPEMLETKRTLERVLKAREGEKEKKS